MNTTHGKFLKLPLKIAVLVSLSTKPLTAATIHVSIIHTPRGVLRISSDGDDRMEPKVKTQKNPCTKNADYCITRAMSSDTIVNY